ncbi:hypothetical protein FQN50_000130 [Emmonsiellopsis sp. PD_5]|nr:hypothetical protein FQN50_000130 [Emmonsiellopsis sp. PD_5]
MPPTAASAEPARRRTLIMKESGSRWTSKQMDFFNIFEVDLDEKEPDFILNGYLNAPLDQEIERQFKGLSSSNLSKTPHRNLMMQVDSKGKSSWTLLGPFLSTLAAIKESPHKSPPKRELRTPDKRKQVDHGEMVSSTTAIDPGSDDDGNSGGDTSDEHTSEAYSVKTEHTDEESHLDRAKPEAVTQVMIFLFCQAVFEGSRLASRTGVDDTPAPRLEWNVGPHLFDIQSSKAICVSINDGGLFFKGQNPEGFWVTLQRLVYCSIETKARFHKWDDDDLKGSPSEKVQAQEASQLIGMMCQQRIHVTQRSMFMKIATFEAEYIRHFFPSCLVPPGHTTSGRDAAASMATRFANLKLDDTTPTAPPPPLTIHVSREFNLSQGEDLIAAARLVLAMGKYLEENGPLLKCI